MVAMFRQSHTPSWPSSTSSTMPLQSLSTPSHTSFAGVHPGTTVVPPPPPPSPLMPSLGSMKIPPPVAPEPVAPLPLLVPPEPVAVLPPLLPFVPPESVAVVPPLLPFVPPVALSPSPRPALSVVPIFAEQPSASATAAAAEIPWKKCAWRRSCIGKGLLGRCSLTAGVAQAKERKSKRERWALSHL